MASALGSKSPSPALHGDIGAQGLDCSGEGLRPRAMKPPARSVAPESRVSPRKGIAVTRGQKDAKTPKAMRTIHQCERLVHFTFSSPARSGLTKRCPIRIRQPAYFASGAGGKQAHFEVQTISR